MTETAIAVRESPVIEIDLTKASPRVLKHLKAERDKERLMELLKDAGGGAVQVAKLVLSNPAASMVASAVAIELLALITVDKPTAGKNQPLINDYTAGILFAAIIGTKLWESFKPLG